MEKNELYDRAKRRVKAKMGFYTHFAIYAFVNVVLFLGSWRETGSVGFDWFTWPLIGWGIFVLFHFLSVFVFRGGITEKMIQKEIERQKQGSR